MIRIKWVCTFLPLSLFVFPSLSVSLSLSRPIIPSDDNKAPFWLQPRSALPVHTVIYLSCHSSRCCRFYVRPLSLNYSSSIWVMDRLNIIIRYPERSRNIIHWHVRKRFSITVFICMIVVLITLIILIQWGLNCTPMVSHFLKPSQQNAPWMFFCASYEYFQYVCILNSDIIEI